MQTVSVAYGARDQLVRLNADPELLERAGQTKQPSLEELGRRGGRGVQQPVDQSLQRTGSGFVAVIGIDGAEQPKDGLADGLARGRKAIRRRDEMKVEPVHGAFALNAARFCDRMAAQGSWNGRRRDAAGSPSGPAMDRRSFEAWVMGFR